MKMSIFAISPVTNAGALMRGRTALMYQVFSVDRIGCTVGVLTAHYFCPAVMDRILVDNREFFIHHVHSTPPLILIASSTLDRGIQSATEMLASKGGGVRVAHSFNCTPRLSICVLLTHLLFLVHLMSSGQNTAG